MFGFLLLICIYFSHNSEVAGHSDLKAYTINTEGCSIPWFPLVSKSIRDLVVVPPAERPNCNHTVPLVQSNDTHITVDKAAFDTYGVFVESEFFCCYKNFSAYGNTQNISYGKCRVFTSEITREHEFVQIECFYAGDKVYDDFYRFKIYNTKPIKREEGAFSVAMFGLDSVSRQNFLRTMGRTANFLKVRGSIQLQGYNKLGDNSFPNLFPILTGQSYETVKKTCLRYHRMDSEACRFIWDIYKKAGYRTALASDSDIGVLGNYEHMLSHKPTDFYMQTFMSETQRAFKDKTFDYHMCLRNRYIYKELLRYVKDVFDTVGNGKLFAFFWEESVTHEHLTYARLMDEDYHKTLTTLEERGYLDDTVVIFFSDHGTRFGDILTTEQGRQESRLPIFEIMFPIRFRRRYSLAYNNFKSNSKRLTTANDVHETLLDLVNSSRLEDFQIKERTKDMRTDVTGISLFLPIPSHRTCKSLDIPEHWCACAPGNKMSVGQKGQMVTTKYVLSHINQILGEFPMCHKLQLAKIIDVLATKEKTTPMKRFRVILQTSPGNGIFEATLVQERKLWTLSGSVSRLNSYGNQSHCVTDPVAKNYCYCRR